MEKSVKQCDVSQLQTVLGGASECQVVDVREPSEVKTEAIEGALNLPLSNFSSQVSRLSKNRPVYLLCRSGTRAKDAASQLERRGFKDIFVVRGGIREWIEAGKPVIRSVSRVWAIERQVRFVAGALVLTGILLALTLHPYFIGLSLFVAAGLIYSALTDTCGMAFILLQMPWNKG
jgi:rhodanese-related sulfurtransferase